MSDERVEDFDDETPPPRPPPPPTSKSFVGRMWGVQHRIERRIEGVRRGRIARVLRMARKPEPEEFRQSATIVLVGIAVIGGIGFLVYLLMGTILSWLQNTF